MLTPSFCFVYSFILLQNMCVKLLRNENSYCCIVVFRLLHLCAKTCQKAQREK